MTSYLNMAAVAFLRKLLDYLDTEGPIDQNSSAHGELRELVAKLDAPQGPVGRGANILDIEIRAALARARQKHPRPFTCRHHAFAVLLEEVDELWDAIKKDMPVAQVRTELTHVAAMALRALEDLWPAEEGT